MVVCHVLHDAFNQLLFVSSTSFPYHWLRIITGTFAFWILNISFYSSNVSCCRASFFASMTAGVIWNCWSLLLLSLIVVLLSEGCFPFNKWDESSPRIFRLSALYVSDTTQIDWFNNMIHTYTMVYCWYLICERLRQMQCRSIRCSDVDCRLFEDCRAMES